MVYGYRRGVALSLFVLTSLCIPAHAREAVVTTLEGKTLKGELLSEDDQTVVLRIAGIRTPISRDDIESVAFPNIPEQFGQHREKLADHDLRGRYNLAYWVFEKGDYGLAKGELDSIKASLNDDSPTALRQQVEHLSTVVDQRLQHQADQTGESTRPDSDRPVGPQMRRGAPDAHEPAERLTTDQVNLIRVYEIDLDQKPKVVVSRDTIAKFFKNYAADERTPKGFRDQRKFKMLKGHEQLDVLFKLQARDLYPEVRVTTDPPALRDFRHRVNPRYVAPYFRRHFGTGAVDGFKLFGRRSNTVDEAYTNFYILTKTEVDKRPMINRDHPEQSLLLQWGLPRDAAMVPAPDVKGWRPFFTDRDDPKFQIHVDWIKSLYNPAPDYGIDYKLPGSTADEPDPDRPVYPGASEADEADG